MAHKGVIESRRWVIGNISSSRVMRRNCIRRILYKTFLCKSSSLYSLF